jgi:hypothetical protein
VWSSGGVLCVPHGGGGKGGPGPDRQAVLLHAVGAGQGGSVTDMWASATVTGGGGGLI